MGEKSLIYVAGNPDAYPLEYYDPDTQTYEGVIPQLLRQFSAQSTYEIVYYQPDRTDRRSQLAEKNQVDLLSGYTEGDTVPQNTGYVTLFRTEYNGKETAYQLYFTAAAPKSIQSELQAYLDTVSQEEITGLLVETAEVPQVHQTMYWAIGSLAIIIVLLVSAIVLLVRSYGKKLRHAQQNVETDETTGLGNMEYLTRYYKQYVNDQNRILYQLIYFYVDTDRLRRISGSQEADEFLRYCAVVFEEYLGDSDILARVSDHGFVLLKLIGSADSLDDWFHVILDRISSFTQLYGKPFESGVYAGVYSLRPQDRDLNEMIFQASQGAYAAQREGVGYVYCSEQMVEMFVQERQLQARIDQGFSKREFQLYLQFYVDAQSFRVIGGEALARWNHPQKGILTPGTFIPLMEREKMISRLDYYCLEEVCSFLDSLMKDGIDTFFISCNFSRETFASPSFAAQVKEIMDQYTFPRELLILEITESAAVRDVAQIQQNILSLKEYGVRIALDDFGEGFTSFYDLQKYSIDGIKLDKGLVDHIMTPCGCSILRAMIQVGHELDMTILAEGVETDEQVQVLQEIHCDVIQGFRFSHPLPQWEAKKQLKTIFHPQTVNDCLSV